MNRACFTNANLHENKPKRAASGLFKTNYLRMKKTLLFITFTLFSLLIYSQSIQYSYDASGNRVKRTIVPLTKSARSTSSLADTVKTQELSKIEEQFNFEKLAEGKIKIFPNPTKGALTIKLENIANLEGINLQLYNVKGALLQSGQVHSNISYFNMQDYTPGTYILRVSRQEEKLEYKIVKY
jgi:Secretion system C-terminal sorting domain